MMLRNLDLIAFTVGYAETVEAKRIAKIAGVGLAGFIVAAGVADKVNLNPIASQVAGFVGAFLGSLAAKRRDRTTEKEKAPPQPRQE